MWYYVNIKQRKIEKEVIMQRIQKDYRTNYLELNYGDVINQFIFYNKDGIICTADYDSLEDVDGNRFTDFNVLQVLKTEKTFRKEETEQAFVNKQMKKGINFSIPLKDKTWYGDTRVKLFLYVDNEFITIKEQVKSKSETVYASILEKAVYNYTTYTFEIDGKIAVLKHLDTIDHVKYEEIKQQAKELFNEVYRIAYIDNEKFNQIFNEYELVRRETPLIRKEA